MFPFSRVCLVDAGQADLVEEVAARRVVEGSDTVLGVLTQVSTGYDVIGTGRQRARQQPQTLGHALGGQADPAVAHVSLLG